MAPVITYSVRRHRRRIEWNNAEVVQVLDFLNCFFTLPYQDIYHELAWFDSQIHSDPVMP